jgi:hypothetical protein
VSHRPPFFQELLYLKQRGKTLFGLCVLVLQPQYLQQTMGCVESNAAQQNVRQIVQSNEPAAAPLDEEGCVKTLLDSNSTKDQLMYAVESLFTILSKSNVSHRQMWIRCRNTPGFIERCVQLMRYDDEYVCGYAVELVTQCTANSELDLLHFPGMLDSLTYLLSRNDEEISITGAAYLLMQCCEEVESAVDELRQRNDILKLLENCISVDDDIISFMTARLYIILADEEKLKKINISYKNVDRILGELNPHTC